MIENGKKNVLCAIGVAAAALYSLLSISHSNAAQVDIYFTGLVSPPSSHAHSYNGTMTRSPKMELHQPGEDREKSLTTQSISHQSPRVIHFHTTSMEDTVVMSFPGTGSPSAPLGDSAALGLNLNGDAILNHVQSNPLPFGDVERRNQAFTNTQLPTSPPSLSSFANTQQRVLFEDTEGATRIVTLSRVSLPASVWLFGTGLVALVGLGSRGILSHKHV